MSKRTRRRLSPAPSLTYASQVSLSCFAPAEEAALRVARSPEEQAAAERAAARRRSSGGSSSATASANPKRAAVRTSLPKARKAARREKAEQAAAEEMSDEHEEEQMQEPQAAGLAGEAAGQRFGQGGHRQGAEPPTHTSRACVREDEQARALEAAAARNVIIGAAALDVIYEAAGAATDELSAEVAAEVMLMVVAREEGMWLEEAGDSLVQDDMW